MAPLKVLLNFMQKIGWPSTCNNSRFRQNDDHAARKTKIAFLLEIYVLSRSQMMSIKKNSIYKNHIYPQVALGQAFVQKLLHDAATSGPVFCPVSSVFASLQIVLGKFVTLAYLENAFGKTSRVFGISVINLQSRQVMVNLFLIPCLFIYSNL